MTANFAIMSVPWPLCKGWIHMVESSIWEHSVRFSSHLYDWAIWFCHLRSWNPSLFSVRFAGVPQRAGLLLGYAGVNEQEIREGIKHLTRVVEGMR
nr:hypothetical protein [Reticulibacter mediterranei]